MYRPALSNYIYLRMTVKQRTTRHITMLLLFFSICKYAYLQFLDYRFELSGVLGKYFVTFQYAFKID